MRGAWLPALLAAVKSWMRRLAGTRRAKTLSDHPWLHPLAKRAQVPKWLRGERSRSVNPMFKQTLKKQFTQSIELHLFTTQWKLRHFSNCSGGSQEATISADGRTVLLPDLCCGRNLFSSSYVEIHQKFYGRNKTTVLAQLLWLCLELLKLSVGQCRGKKTATVTWHQGKTTPNPKLQTSCYKDRFMGVTLMNLMPFGGCPERLVNDHHRSELNNSLFPVRKWQTLLASNQIPGYSGWDFSLDDILSVSVSCFFESYENN